MSKQEQAKQYRNVEIQEEIIMEEMLERIRDAADPVDQFKAVERYNAFNIARGHRLDAERGSNG